MGSELYLMEVEDGRYSILLCDGSTVTHMNSLKEASSLLLGHLKMGQPISTLSGGENIRVKLLKAMKSTAKVFGIDEPFKGLSNTEIYCVAQYLDRLRKNGGTVIVVDHSDMIEQYFSKHIELTSDNGVLKDINQP